MANFLLEKQFREYIIKKQESTNKEIVSLVKQQYSPLNTWNIDAIRSIGINALEQGLIVRVKDTKGEIIWDATKHNSGLCAQMIEHMSKNMTSRYGKWQGKYTEENFAISINGDKVGIANIGYYGPFYFNDNDLLFINTLNIVLLSIAVFAVLFSLVFGAIFSRRISNPIEKVIDTAQNISLGNYKVKSNQKTNTKELHELILAVNQLADSLNKQEGLRKQLTMDVSHELRTPMAILQSHIEAMIDGVWEPTIERLKSCQEEIIRLNKMIGELGNLAKYEREDLILNKTNFNIGELISNILLNFESPFKSKGVDIFFESKSVHVCADKDKISQVMINLTSNALKYTQAGGKVEIDIRKGDSNVEISIKDNGQGISQDDLPYIFERFYRADKSRNRMTGGAGIGLTISKAIIQAHGGSIDLESELNKGTKVIVKLPKKGD
jgi:signal transduction histidine kinase